MERAWPEGREDGEGVPKGKCRLFGNCRNGVTSADGRCPASSSSIGGWSVSFPAWPRRRPASVLHQHSCSTRTHGPASLPSSWNVKAPELSWTVIRSIAYALARAAVIVGGDRHHRSCSCRPAPKAEAMPAKRVFSLRSVSGFRATTCESGRTRKSERQSRSAEATMPILGQLPKWRH